MRGANIKYKRLHTEFKSMLPSISPFLNKINKSNIKIVYIFLLKMSENIPCLNFHV